MRVRACVRVCVCVCVCVLCFVSAEGCKTLAVLVDVSVVVFFSLYAYRFSRHSFL